METGAQDFGDHLKNFGKTMLRVLADTAIQEVSKIEGVQKEIEAQKLGMGKEVVWKVFPFVAIGLILLIVIGRFKVA
ncbi:hypothetical protein ES703_67335 [subsurface metagenome]